MTKDELNELKKITEILEGAFKDKYDTTNGWKTERAVFETETMAELKAINIKLTPVEKIPVLVNTVNDIQSWRKKVNKVLVYITTAIVVPIVLFIIYQELK